MATSPNATDPSSSNPLSALPKIPALDNSYGAMLLGTSLGLMLYGLTLHQTYRYFRLYPRDLKLFKIFVLAIVTMETVHTIIWMVACYHFLITDYFNPASILTGHWSVKINVAVTGASNLICQSFYARRVFLLGPKSRWVVAVAGVSMVACLGFDIGASVEAFKLSLSDFPRFSWLVSGAYGCAVATDVLLTGALIRVLLHSRTGFKRTDSTLDTLIVYSINTGLLTRQAIILWHVLDESARLRTGVPWRPDIALEALILPGNYIYAGISIVNAKLYANSVLAVLNSRRSLASSKRVVDDFEMYPTSGSQSSRTQRSHNGAVDTWNGPQVSVSLHPAMAAVKVPAPHDRGHVLVLGREEKDGRGGDLMAASSVV
ncbi:uncharacterized protein TRAVEDRAFT_48938 [Trametes versicolor FP-101664 SS1]|uniref:uncharacterized protein n=1 Tax=Trametes versicolor (strain FP-101664) TaxID=717944 RepID=UPI00046246BE|nr:uncharacterized protein TRAVEDRAFT_48938 [Trametes versicolor FP-101664 SS1]EIW57915.1 hypothetical protein TRAVEDRAFT_48938 [Trametes versicolor FP-101664 SS1]